MPRASQKETLGLPPGFQVFSSFPFAGLSLSTGRTGMRDQQFFDIENFVKVGEGNLRTLWDVGAPIFSAADDRTIINAFFYNIATTNYAVTFLSDGTAIQTNAATKAQTI